MRKIYFPICLICITGLLTSSCKSYSQDGALTGGLVGGMVGLSARDNGKSGLIGMAAGAITGTLIGSVMDRKVKKKLEEFDGKLEQLLSEAPSEELQQKKLDLIVLEYDFLRSKYEEEKAIHFLKTHLKEKNFTIKLSLDDLKYLREKQVSYQLIDCIWTFEAKEKGASV